MGHVHGCNNGENNSLFSASFCDGEVEGSVLADSGSDANLMSAAMLENILEINPRLAVKHSEKEVTFKNAHVSAPMIYCHKEICTDVLLRVRHSIQLLLRGLNWLVQERAWICVFGATCTLSIRFEQSSSACCCCRQVPRCCRCARCTCKGWKSNTSCTTIDESTEIHSILSDSSFEHGSTFHSSGEESYTEDSDIYIDIGEDPEEDLSRAIQKMIDDAVANGLSPEGAKSLEGMIKKYFVYVSENQLQLMSHPWRHVCKKIPFLSRYLRADILPINLQKYVEQLQEIDFVEEMPTTT